MAFCRHCGMESADAVNCEWCKRPVAPQPPVGQATEPPPMPVRTTMDIVEEEEEKLRAWRRNFFISCAILLVVASSVIIWKPPFFAWVTIASAFLAGMILIHWRMIDPFSDDWMLVGILFLLTAFVPAFFVCLGYIIYGLMNRRLDSNVLWLYGTYLALTTALQVPSILAWPHGFPVSALVKLHGTQVLSFGAISFGWAWASSMVTWA